MKRRARPWLLPRLASPAALLRLVAAAARVRCSVDDRIDIKIRCRKTRPEARTIVSCVCVLCGIQRARRGSPHRCALSSWEAEIRCRPPVLGVHSLAKAAAAQPLRGTYCTAWHGGKRLRFVPRVGPLEPSALRL